ncbi:MAG: hypothetical protein IJ048_01050, partial [Clostridia bacterium]|nr:hypothetical protein [Clostridia bacterium]
DKRREGGGALRVALRGAEGLLIFSVQDNGPGVSEELLRRLNGGESGDSAKGYGVRNVNDRIRLTYGEGYGVSVSNAETGGCLAELRLPRLDDAPGGNE